VGASGEGYEYSDYVDDIEGGAPGLVYEEAMFADSASTLASDISEPTSPINGSRSQSFATNISDDDGTDRFQHDTVAILLQRMHEGKMADDMLSELMGLRFSGGADETQVRKAVAIAIARRISSQIEEGMAAADASKRTLTAYNTLIRRAQAEQTTQEQVSFLLDAQRDLTRRHEGGKVLLLMSKDIYDMEVFGEEPFVSWWNDSRSNVEPDMAEVRKQTEQFIEWLENAESESEEDEDSD
jgi:translation initiation factor eIF-2B subunit epsilon